MMRSCLACGTSDGMVRFENETHRVEYRGGAIDVGGLDGWRCTRCGEIVFDSESADRYAAAGDELVLADRRAVGAELRRIRRKLGLSQADAARLAGGGHNAFSRYETGKVTPPAAVLNLFRMLDRHPDDVRMLDQTGERLTGHG